MSALGQKQTFALRNAMSALPLKADMCSALGDVRFVPETDMAIPARFKIKRPPTDAASSPLQTTPYSYEKNKCLGPDRLRNTTQTQFDLPIA